MSKRVLFIKLQFKDCALLSKMFVKFTAKDTYILKGITHKKLFEKIHKEKSYKTKKKNDCLLIQIMYNHITNLQNNVSPTISPKTTTFSKKKQAPKTEKKTFFVHNKLRKTQERKQTELIYLFLLHLNLNVLYIYTIRYTIFLFCIWLPFSWKYLIGK